MRWLKHLATAQDDEAMSELIDRFGWEGYGFWWGLLEKIAQLMDGTDRCSAKYSLKRWSSDFRMSAKKFTSLVSYLEKQGRIRIATDSDDYLVIECRNLLKYKDEWSERQAKLKAQYRDAGSRTVQATRDADSRVNSRAHSGANARATEAHSHSHSDPHPEAPPTPPPAGGAPQPVCVDAEIQREYHRLLDENAWMRDSADNRADAMREARAVVAARQTRQLGPFASMPLDELAGQLGVPSPRVADAISALGNGAVRAKIAKIMGDQTVRKPARVFEAWVNEKTSANGESKADVEQVRKAKKSKARHASEPTGIGDVLESITKTTELTP